VRPDEISARYWAFDQAVLDEAFFKMAIGKSDSVCIIGYALFRSGEW
jgi:hypothetical protein